jgi:predicted lipoprotein
MSLRTSAFWQLDMLKKEIRKTLKQVAVPYKLEVKNITEAWRNRTVIKKLNRNFKLSPTLFRG